MGREEKEKPVLEGAVDVDTVDAGVEAGVANPKRPPLADGAKGVEDAVVEGAATVVDGVDEVVDGAEKRFEDVDECWKEKAPVDGCVDG